MSSGIVYVGQIVNDHVEEAYDLQHYALPANNKKRGIVDSLRSVGTDVTVVSPMWINENSFRYFSGRRIRDEELDCEIRYPPALDVFGINYLFLALVTTVLTIRTVRSEDSEAVVFYNFQLQTAVPALAARLLLGTPIVVEYEDGFFLSDIAVQRWVARLTRRLCDPFLGGAVCVNGALAAMLRTDNVAIVRGFPSVGMPDELPDPSYDSEETVVMFAGNFDAVRGIDSFLTVAERITDRRGGFEFWISGYGPDHQVERVRSRLDDIGSDRIRFFGTLPWDEYRDRLVSADLLINAQDPTAPVSPYTFPSKLLDFMAAGAVTVSTDMADLAEAFDDELVIDGTTAEDLTETILEIDARGLDAYEPYVKRGRRWVGENCNREQIGSQLDTVIHRAADAA